MTAATKKPAFFQALHITSVLLLLASLTRSSAALGDCGEGKRGGPTLFSHDHGVSSTEAAGIVIFQCGNHAPSLTAPTPSALADAGSMTLEELSALINAACT